MKKIIVKIAVVFMLLLIPSSGLAHTEANGLILNGKSVSMDVRPVIVKGRTLVPARAILEELGYEVYWNSHDRTVIGQKYDSRIELTIDNPHEGSNFYNGIGVELDVPAQIYRNRTLVPARLVSELAGLDVRWDNQSRNVVLSTSHNKLNINEAYDKVIEFDRERAELLSKDPSTEFFRNIDFMYSYRLSAPISNLYIFQQGMYMSYSVNIYSGEVKHYSTFEM